MQQLCEMVTRLTNFWHKYEKKNPQILFFGSEPLRFRHTCPSFLFLKLIQSVVGSQLIISGFQGPSFRVLIVRVPDLRVPSLRVTVPGFRVSGFQFPGVRVPGPGWQVLNLDYALKSPENHHYLKKHWKYTLNAANLIHFVLSERDKSIKPCLIFLSVFKTNAHWIYKKIYKNWIYKRYLWQRCR